MLDQHALDALVRLSGERSEKLAERLAERRHRAGAAERGVAAGRWPERYVRGGDAVTLRLEASLGDRILELAYVSRPGMCRKRGLGLGHEADDRALLPQPLASQEMVGEQQHVVL